jgi:disulfide oxidoreductase YuzD
MDYEKKYKEFQEAKERVEQHMFPIILMFDDIIDGQYNDLKNNYTEEHEKLFIKNVDFVLKKIS